MLVVGLTGGIASGKSFVIKYLQSLKIPTHESDKFIRSLYRSPSRAFLKHLKKIGFENFITKQNIKKNKIRQVIFTNVKKRKALEGFLHKEVKKDRDIFLKKNKKNKKDIVFLDIPLLFEKNLQKQCDLVCSTIAPLKKRQERAIKRTNINKEVFSLIVKIQVKDKIRRLNSDYIINTGASKHKTRLQIDKIIYDILKKTK